MNREIWSSPLVYRRASKTHFLGLDAKAFNTEATRRVKVNIDKNFSGVGAGDRILVMGEDQNGKTDKLGPILVQTGSSLGVKKVVTQTYRKAACQFRYKSAHQLFNIIYIVEDQT